MHIPKFRLRGAAIAVCLAMGFATRCNAGAFPDSVKSFTPGFSSEGTTVTFGASFFPGNVLGAPNGSADGLTPTDEPEDLLTLGTGGEIILEFRTTRIVDGSGPDFTVFENPVAYDGFPGLAFVEAAIVSVSDDGVIWHTYPFHFTPATVLPASGIPFQLYEMNRYSGLAGVHPVFSSPTDGISPFDPNVSGGDSFDLADVGLAQARFVKIRDAGTTGPTQNVDPEGHILDDPGNYLFGLDTAGFDLDAVAAIHSVPAPTAVRREDWLLYE